MKLLSWNIRHGGGRTAALAPALIAHEPDVIVLSEYRINASARLIEQLRFFGWLHMAVSNVAGEENGVAVLSRHTLTIAPAPCGPAFDKWMVEASIPAHNLTVMGIYAPLQNSTGSSPVFQRRFWDAVHRLVESRRDERLLLVGDFNTCAPGADGPTPLPCSDAFDRLPTLGWVDAWRACNPGKSDFSYVHRTGTPRTMWRIDHAFVSPPLAWSVRRCYYSHSEREQKLSDHSMLIVECK